MIGAYVETVEMGYLPMKDVDWETFASDLKSLPKTNSKNIINYFNKKWSPEVVAKYILDTIRKG